ncbi:SAM-dependent methyltransferase [Spirosoma aureum]|uniref:SAM-dependent methyltransferase n=1 Tax=Spirosoma aureum TaxID=2692134 RepID=A0A6G9AU63_9BACT|nr:class I SAM-dependent methyltransferase [Spirosoma aureum]QIP15866.1 SAM-dependent methyltransferase [Spirosoma aureum]
MSTLSTAEKLFVSNHIADDIRALALRKQPADIDTKKVIAQIAARQKARDKLPTWYANNALVFPPALSVEQASSERTAHYKASLVSGQLLFDLTGGMGVDTWAFAQRVNRVVYVEQRPELVELAAHNLPLLNASNVDTQTGNGLEVIAHWPDTADWIYLDPHRRDEQGGKVSRLEDCEPDISSPGTLSALLAKGKRILVKASPLLDVDFTVRQLFTVEAVHIVAVQNEVKEIMLVIGKQPVAAEAVVVTAINMTATGDAVFQFIKGDESTASVTLNDPQQYVYEPNAAVMKAGAFRLVANRFDLSKLAPNSHLYTSNELRSDFPGRTFRVEAVVKPDRKIVQSLIPAMKANLTVRNFPQSVAELRKKLVLQEGGDIYIFATTLQNGDKRLLITRKSEQLDTQQINTP